MVLEFRETMNSRACDVLRSGRKIASLQWHEKQPPRIVVSYGWTLLELSELRQIFDEYERIVRESGRKVKKIKRKRVSVRV